MPSAQTDELIEAFELLEDWEERYRFIIDLGKQLPPLEPALKVESHRVYGCQSTVYMVPWITETDPPTLAFVAESDAAIVNGLIAILHRVYVGQTPQEALDFEIDAFLRQLGLSEQLSPTRRNGLFEMVKRLRTFAQAAVAGGNDKVAR